MTATEIINKWKNVQAEGKIQVCPRCGKRNMRLPLTTNALSRRVDLYICSECGMAEALEDFATSSNNGVKGWVAMNVLDSCSEEYDDVELCTFPDDDDDYCKIFTVPKKWLLDLLERMDGLNNNQGVDLEQFLEEYVWDETALIYEQAINEDKLKWEGKQH